eukprot:56344_1
MCALKELLNPHLIHLVHQQIYQVRQLQFQPMFHHIVPHQLRPMLHHQRQLQTMLHHIVSHQLQAMLHHAPSHSLTPAPTDIDNTKEAEDGDVPIQILVIIVSILGTVCVCTVVCIVVCVYRNQNKLRSTVLFLTQSAGKDSQSPQKHADELCIEHPKIKAKDSMSNGQMTESEGDKPTVEGMDNVLDNDGLMSSAVTVGADDVLSNKQRNEEHAQRKLLKMWLANDVKLAQYYNVLVDNGYDSLSIVKEIKEEDELSEIGIVLKGDLLKLMKAIKRLDK